MPLFHSPSQKNQHKILFASFYGVVLKGSAKSKRSLVEEAFLAQGNFLMNHAFKHSKLKVPPLKRADMNEERGFSSLLTQMNFGAHCC